MKRKSLCIILVCIILLLISSCTLFNPEFPIKVRDIDGNVYQTIKIGDQLWMAENLKVTHYRNGEEIPNLISDSSWVNDTLGAYCAYDNDEKCVDTCGYLYNWYAVNNPNGLAPEGWHIPSDEEWKQLEIFMGMSLEHADSIGYRGTFEAQKLKSTYGWYWVSGTDDYGFNALPCGVRYCSFHFKNVEFNQLEAVGCFWTSSDTTQYYAWSRRLNYSDTRIARWATIFKADGFSVRCVKDSE